MHLKQVSWAAGLMLLASSVQAAPQPEIQELFKASRTPGRRVVAYPQGTPEMRVVRVGLPVGATIPLHTHPSPVVVVVTKGAMINVRLVDGNEVVSVVRPRDGFLDCLLYTSPSPRDRQKSRMPSSA